MRSGRERKIFSRERFLVADRREGDREVARSGRERKRDRRWRKGVREGRRKEKVSRPTNNLNQAI